MKSNKTTALLMLLVFLLVVSVVIIFLTGLDRPDAGANPDPGGHSDTHSRADQRAGLLSAFHLDAL